MLNKFFQQQQVIMTLLGHYDGKCDGVWGPKCIAAKRAWEMTDEFEPAVPTNGNPFTGRGKLPKGMTWGYQGLVIVWAGLDPKKVAEILEQKGELLTVDHVRRHVFQDTSEPETVEEQPTYVAPEPAIVQDQQVTTLKPFYAPVEEVIDEQPKGPEDSDVGTEKGTEGEDGSDAPVEDPVEPQDEEESEQDAPKSNAIRRRDDWRNNKKR